MNWKNISLYKFQQIDAINKQPIDELDKILFTTCQVFGLTDYQLNNMGGTWYGTLKAKRLIAKAVKIFETEFKPKEAKRFGFYKVEYDPSRMTYGQYVELSYFMQSKNEAGEVDAHVKNGHYILASICNYPIKKLSSDHVKKADYFLTAPIEKVVGTAVKFIENFNEFNKRYTSLFGLAEEVEEEVKQDKFNTRYGWIYCASSVAEYHRIPLNDVYKMNVKEVLNSLAYLKEKAAYEERISKLK